MSKVRKCDGCDKMIDVSDKYYSFDISKEKVLHTGEGYFLNNKSYDICSDCYQKIIKHIPFLEMEVIENAKG